MPGAGPGPPKKQWQVLRLGRRPAVWLLLPAPKLTSMVTAVRRSRAIKICAYVPHFRPRAWLKSLLCPRASRENLLLKQRNPVCHQEIRILITSFCASALGRENTLIHDNKICAHFNTRASCVRWGPLQNYVKMSNCLTWCVETN